MKKEIEKKPKEKIIAIKRKRAGEGYFSCADMVDMFAKHGIIMRRQTYSNKEIGKSKFNVAEIQVLANVFDMSLADAIRLFNDWD